MAVKTSFKWDSLAVDGLQKNITRGLLRMGLAIAVDARSNAPVLSGALRDSIRVTTDGRHNVYVLAGGSVGGKNINYAYIREFHNNLHPETRHYLGRAFDKVSQQDLGQYFKEIK